LLRRIVLWAACSAATACCAAPKILSPYRSRVDVDARNRIAEHAGVDFGARAGAPVLAAADGEGVAVTGNLSGCGFGVLLFHESFDRFTVYCHLKMVFVEEHQQVKRGDRIGLVGTSGNSGDVPHVHLELCWIACPIGHADGRLHGTEDPLPIAVGFFVPGKKYPTDRLVLTYPVRCADGAAPVH